MRKVGPNAHLELWGCLRPCTGRGNFLYYMCLACFVYVWNSELCGNVQPLNIPSIPFYLYNQSLVHSKHFSDYCSILFIQTGPGGLATGVEERLDQLQAQLTGLEDRVEDLEELGRFVENVIIL